MIAVGKTRFDDDSLIDGHAATSYAWRRTLAHMAIRQIMLTIIRRGAAAERLSPVAGISDSEDFWDSGGFDRSSWSDGSGVSGWSDGSSCSAGSDGKTRSLVEAIRCSSQIRRRLVGEGFSDMSSRQPEKSNQECEKRGCNPSGSSDLRLFHNRTAPFACLRKWPRFVT